MSYSDSPTELGLLVVLTRLIPNLFKSRVPVSGKLNSIKYQFLQKQLVGVCFRCSDTKELGAVGRVQRRENNDWQKACQMIKASGQMMRRGEKDT
jgi:hypothetical protein